MYACKLHFNGIARKVLIDDFVPVRKDGKCMSEAVTLRFPGKVLSAHTSNKRDMWVTLLEKAFIKLMGGSYFVQGHSPYRHKHQYTFRTYLMMSTSRSPFEVHHDLCSTVCNVS